MSSTVNSRTLSRDSTYATQAESALRTMILEGTIAPSERLNEVALASTLGISRGPLREAVQRLASAGLLTIISHRGAFVRTFDRREVVESYEVRAALEVRAVQIVGTRCTDADLRELDAMLAETKSRMSTTTDRAYPPELDFHLRLVMLADVAALTTMLTDLYNQLSLARSMSARLPVRARAAVDEHRDLVEALKNRQVREAIDLMDRHLEHSRDSAMAALGLPKVEGDE